MTENDSFNRLYQEEVIYLFTINDSMYTIEVTTFERFTAMEKGGYQ